jgi:hypothetical protein
VERDDRRVAVAAGVAEGLGEAGRWIAEGDRGRAELVQGVLDMRSVLAQAAARSTSAL